MFFLKAMEEIKFNYYINALLSIQSPWHWLHFVIQQFYWGWNNVSLILNVVQKKLEQFFPIIILFSVHKQQKMDVIYVHIGSNFYRVLMRQFSSATTL